MDALSGLPGEIFSKCGLVSGLLLAAVLWLAVQLAKRSAKAEADRDEMLKLIGAKTQAYENLALAKTMLEGMLIARK